MGPSPMIWAVRNLDDKKDKTVKWVVMIVSRGYRKKIYTTCHSRSNFKHNLPCLGPS